MIRGNPLFPAYKPPASVQLWEGWFFENNHIWDRAGNRYSQRDIELSWQSEIIIDGHLGKSRNITVLKDELERRNLLSTLPKVVLVYESKDQFEEVVFDLVRHIKP